MIYNKDFSYSFDENKCKECGGKCCTGESGYIFLDDIELNNLAEFFKMQKDEFIKNYCIKIKNRYSLREKLYLDGYACIFFNEDEKNCGIYNLRPKQCKTFPFWEYFKKNVDEVKKECIGICF